MDQALNQKIDAYIAENKEQLLQDIAALVAIDSVEGTPEEGAPFGAGPRAALDKTLELAAGMGFATRNCENYIGYAELAGADPEKYLATICHVDVVPVGNGWTADPFKMRIQDGWLLGRGVSDDKGPMIVTLYALKFLKEQGYQLRYPIRAIVGDNEETHMNDVKYYLENYPAPVFCFTPDAEFPVCNGEKGHFGGKIVSPVCNGVIAEFEGGVANNAVPDRASALVKTDIRKLKNAPNITLEPEGDGVRVRGWGKSGHAAMPEGTVNAIGLVADYLLDNGLCNDAERAYLEALRKLHSSTAGTGLGIDCADGPFGPLTIIGGRIYMEDGKLVQTIDSRFPTCTNGEMLAVLWEDKPDTASLHSHLRNLIFDLSHTLEDAGVRGLLVRGRSTLAIDTSKVECDYYNFLRGDRSTISSYRGEYMTQYSWAEVTRSALRQQAAASQKGGLPSYYVPPTGF